MPTLEIDSQGSAHTKTSSKTQFCQIGKSVINIESKAILALMDRIGDNFIFLHNLQCFGSEQIGMSGDTVLCHDVEYFSSADITILIDSAA